MSIEINFSVFGSLCIFLRNSAWNQRCLFYPTTFFREQVSAIQLDDIEEENENISDHIETTNYNVAQGYKIYRMLRERRQHRKEIVRELNRLKVLTEIFVNLLIHSGDLYIIKSK